MRRKRTRVHRKKTNFVLISLQIAMLVLALVLLIFSRGFVSSGAGNLFNTVTAPDVSVQQQEPKPVNTDSNQTPPPHQLDTAPK